MLLMMSLTALSQDIVIKRSILESMYKESRICDSLRVRYNEKSDLLNSLIKSNEQTTNLLVNELNKSKNLDVEIAKINNQLQKKKRNVLFYAGGGFIVGIIVKSLIIK